MSRSLRFPLLILVWLAVLAQVAGCSKSGSPPFDVARTAPAPAAQPPAANRMSACEMLNASEMTVVLGGAVSARPSGETKCIYSPLEGSAPYAELEIDRGDGEAAFGKVAKSGLIEPGSPNPLAGIGSQTALVGPVLFARSGPDLVKITVAGSVNGPAALRAIFMLVKPRL